jgi:hypothetical protein
MATRHSKTRILSTAGTSCIHVSNIPRMVSYIILIQRGSQKQCFCECRAHVHSFVLFCDNNMVPTLFWMQCATGLEMIRNVARNTSKGRISNKDISYILQVCGQYCTITINITNADYITEPLPLKGITRCINLSRITLVRMEHLTGSSPWRWWCSHLLLANLANSSKNGYGHCFQNQFAHSYFGLFSSFLIKINIY